MNVLFFPQNETHVENMKPISKVLANNDIHSVYLDSSAIFHQKLKLKNVDVDESLSDINIKSFYFQNFLERIKTVIFLKKSLKEISEKYDFLVVGNDGAVQRMLVTYFKREGKKSFMILDGIISNYEFNFFDILIHSPLSARNYKQYFKDKFKKTIYILFRNTFLSPFIPSVAGASTCFKAIFVIGNHTKEVLENNYKAKNVIASGLPRFSIYNRSKILSHSEIKRIFYISSAFEWHGLNEYDCYQKKDIELLVDFVSKHSNTVLYLKPHPREKKDFYSQFKDFSNVKIEFESNLQQMFNESDVVISSISTGLIESLLVGKPTYCLMIHFPYWKFKYSFISNSNFIKIFNENDLYKCIFAPLNLLNDNKIVDIIKNDHDKSIQRISGELIKHAQTIHF